MTHEAFMNEMKTIIADFGGAEYTPNRMKLIWEACHDLPDRNFRAIVTHFCRSRPVKYPPLPDHFAEEATRQRKILAGDRFQSPREPISDPVSSSQALERVLAQLGVSSLAEAIQRQRPSVTTNPHGSQTTEKPAEDGNRDKGLGQVLEIRGERPPAHNSNIRSKP